MENDPDFETLIAGFIEHNVGISGHFLSDALSVKLKSNLLALHAQKLLLAAGTGNAGRLMHDAAVRSDAIYWLDKQHGDAHENAFFARIEDFIRYLNQTCYAGITGCEFHYSLYEEGSFYQKHLDQFKNNSGRQYSMVSYLNEDWQQGDGGQLMVYQKDNDREIAPTQGKTVFFKSDELMHEVLVTHRRRMSVTGWLKRS